MAAFRDSVISEKFCLPRPINMGRKGGHLDTSHPNAVGHSLVDDIGTLLLRWVVPAKPLRRP